MICGQNVLRLKRWRDPCSGRSLFSYFLKESISLRWNSTSTYIYKWPQKRKKDKRQQTRSNEWIFKLPQVVTFGGGLKEKKRTRKRERLPLLFFFIQSFCQRQKKKSRRKQSGVPVEFPVFQNESMSIFFLYTHTWVCVCVYIRREKKRKVGRVKDRLTCEKMKLKAKKIENKKNYWKLNSSPGGFRFLVQCSASCGMRGRPHNICDDWEPWDTETFWNGMKLQTIVKIKIPLTRLIKMKNPRKKKINVCSYIFSLCLSWFHHLARRSSHLHTYTVC